MVEKVYLPLIKETYDRLGIAVSFVEQPSERNIKAVDEGLFDGDAAYSDLLIKPYTKLIDVQPPLGTSVFILICKQTLPCNKQVLADSRKSVVMTDASEFGLRNVLADRFAVRPYNINELSRIPKLIESGRFDYGVYVTTQIEKLKLASAKAVPLFESDTVHILHRRYGYLREIVGATLQQVIAEYPPD